MTKSILLADIVKWGPGAQRRLHECVEDMSWTTLDDKELVATGEDIWSE